MANYCDKCGNKLKPGAKFCDSCGTATKQNENTDNSSGITCPNCGSAIPLGSVVCTKCGNHLYQKDHKTAITVGYILTVLTSLLIPLLGLLVGVICAIYLFTRKNSDLVKHGIVMVVIPFVFWIIFAFINILFF